MDISQILIAIGVGFALAVVLALVWSAIYRKRAEAQLAEARVNADRIVDDAKKQAASHVKEADLEAKEKLLQMRSEFDKQANVRREEMKNSERRLQQKEEALDKKTSQVESRIAEVEKRDKAIDQREKNVSTKENELQELIEAQRHKLEQVAGLTVEEAKRELIRGIENEAKLEAANIMKRIESEATELGNQKAKKILGRAIQRMASD